MTWHQNVTKHVFAAGRDRQRREKRQESFPEVLIAANAMAWTLRRASRAAAAEQVVQGEVAEQATVSA